MGAQEGKDMKVIEGVHKILIVNLGGIGDLLLSTPALKALRQRYPRAGITLLTTSSAADALKDAPYITSIRAFDMHTGGRAGLARLKVLFELRRNSFDLAINMRTLVSGLSALKIRVLFGIIGARFIAGRNTEGRGRFFDVKVDETSAGHMYERDYDIALVEKLGAKATDTKIDFTVGAGDREKVRKIFQEESIAENGILIGIHPGGRPSRRWPIERFAEVMRKISGATTCSFAVTGDEQERSLAEKVIQSSGVKAVNMAGRLTIKELGALIERCSLFITNDTGAMHIAALLNVPIVAIFGPGSLIRFDPRVISDKAIVLYRKAPCAPCDKMNCRTKECLVSISPQSVAEAAIRLLGAPGEST